MIFDRTIPTPSGSLYSFISHFYVIFIWPLRGFLFFQFLIVIIIIFVKCRNLNITTSPSVLTAFFFFQFPLQPERVGVLILFISFSLPHFYSITQQPWSRESSDRFLRFPFFFFFVFAGKFRNGYVEISS